jgi:ABC-type glycerol-3-phosphate transport system permease component
MKTITIPLPHWRKELVIALVCLLLAIALNAYAIMRFQTPWSELVSSWLYVLAIAVLFFAVTVAFRVLVGGVHWLLRLIKQNNIGRKP